jgi:hypothetical protein
MAFSDLMLESLFAEVWTREQLSMRDRRLILLGATPVSIIVCHCGLPSAPFRRRSC